MLAFLGLAAFLVQEVPTVPTFPAAVELVTVDAVVLDGDGNPVAGLSRDDFVVTEDGRPLEIVGFEAFGPGGKLPATGGITVEASEAAPHVGGRAFAIVLDDLRMAPSRADAGRKAASLFLEKAVRDGDEVTLGTTSGAAWWSARMPEGREDILAVLGRVRGLYVEPTSLDRMSEYEAYWIDTHESGPPHHAPTLQRPGFTRSEEDEKPRAATSRDPASRSESRSAGRSRTSARTRGATPWFASAPPTSTSRGRPERAPPSPPCAEASRPCPSYADASRSCSSRRR